MRWVKRDNSFFNLRKKESIQDNEHTYYRVFNYINVPMDVKQTKKKQWFFIYSLQLLF